MATKPKKKSKPSSNKAKKLNKKTSSKKIYSKKRKKNKKTSSKKYIFILFGIFSIMILVLFAYFLGKNVNLQHENMQKSKITHTKQKRVNKKVKKTKYIHQNKKPKIRYSQKANILHTLKKPKLVIIIDDVHTKAQINAIKHLKMKITPSIFPPYHLAPKSNLLVKNLKHYMIHLPMESGNKQFNTQYKTLKISFSNEQIIKRIKNLRELFPKAKFINNHTGSVFTSDYASMHLAYKIMREYGFVFLDSKTIKTTKVKEIAESYGDTYIARDIFIDNIHTLKAINMQLQKAVNIAKKKGYAIAIGHPHDITMKALLLNKQILKDVELVYIDELYH